VKETKMKKYKVSLKYAMNLYDAKKPCGVYIVKAFNEEQAYAKAVDEFMSTVQVNILEPDMDADEFLSNVQLDGDTEEVTEPKTSVIIRLVDEDVDGCGTDVENSIEVFPIYRIDEPVDKDKLTEFIKETIAKAKDENDYWDTDTILTAVEEALTEKNYRVRFLAPDSTVSF
jgi:hypothetical protein